MPLLLLILIGVALFFIIKYIAVITTIIAIIISGITVIALVSTWMATSYSLYKSGYHPRKAKETYHQVELDLKQITSDLTEIRLQLDDAAPYLRDMEFIRYARENRESDKIKYS